MSYEGQFEQAQIREKLRNLESKIGMIRDAKTRRLLIEKQKCLELQLEAAKIDMSIHNTGGQIANLPRMLLRDYHVYNRHQLKPIGKKMIRLAKYLQNHGILIEVAMNEPIYKVPHYHRLSKEFFINCRQGNYARCEALLSHESMLAHQIDYMGKTPIHWASTKKDQKMANLLLKYRVDVDVHDFTGKTPLSYAISNEDENMVKLILDNRAQPWRDANLSYLEYDTNKWTRKLLIFYRQVWSLLCLFDYNEKTIKWNKILATIDSKPPEYVQNINDVTSFMYMIFN